MTSKSNDGGNPLPKTTGSRGSRASALRSGEPSRSMPKSTYAVGVACCVVSLLIIVTGGTPARLPRTEATDGRPTPVSGWIAEYDAHIVSEVARAAGLLELPPVRMSSFCSSWTVMDHQARARFYADLLFAIAGSESNWK